MSLTLAATDTITGVAGSATSITYTIFGDEVSAGADAFKVLAQGQLPSSVGTLYTTPAATMTIVKTIHLVNGTGGSVTARLNVKGTAAANAILPAITILAGGFAIYADDGWHVYNDQGQMLGVGATGATGATGAAGPAVESLDEGISLTASTASLDFVGAGVTATAVSNAVTVTVPGGPSLGSTPSTQAVGDSAVGGSDSTASKNDHKHAITNPLTTQDDLWVGGASGAPGRLAKGTDGQVLTVDPTTHHLIWATPGSGSSPLTTKGDVWGFSTVDARIPIGTNGQVLTADSAQTLGLKWATPSGGVTVQYPALKPGSPTDDFTAASLGGGWAAHSNAGSFATTDCITQGEDWIGSSLDMQFTAGQTGTIYQTHSNTDFDFTVGGIRHKGLVNGPMMFGIAALDSSGNGVGIVAYTDNSCYMAGITTYNYASQSDQWTSQGINLVTNAGDFWFRLKRVSGTWTGYVSKSGRVWDKTFSTRSDSITVAELHFGILYNTATTTYAGRLIADYYQLDV